MSKPFNADQIATLIRNLEDTSYNEGSHDLACRCSDSLTVIKQLQDALAAVPAQGQCPEGGKSIVERFNLGEKEVRTAGGGTWALYYLGSRSRYLNEFENKFINGALAAAYALPQCPTDHVTMPRTTLEAINAAMNYMGDIMNNMDIVEDEDVSKTSFAFDSVREILAAPAAPVVAASEQDRIDAARYRWIFSQPDGKYVENEFIQTMWREVGAANRIYPTSDEWGAAIDKAIAARANQEPKA